MKRHLLRLVIVLGCMFILTAGVFADNENTDDDKGDIDGAYTFMNETEKYGYRSYLNYDKDDPDQDDYVGARLYDVTIPEDGRLIAEVSNSEIKHMDIEVYSEELKKHICEFSFEIGSGETVTKQTMALPKGDYTVIFGYSMPQDYIIPYAEDSGKKSFNHYISWKKEPHIKGKSVALSQTTASMSTSGHLSLSATVSPSDAYYQDVTWSSSAPAVAKVDFTGYVTAVAPGTAVIKAATKDGVSGSCTVTVLPEEGAAVKVAAGTVKVLSTSARTVAFTKAVKKSSVTVPATVIIGGQTYKVTQINAGAFKSSGAKTVTVSKNVKVIRKNAFKGSKVSKVILKTKLLKKSKVRGCLSGSKVKTVQVKVGSSSQNRKYKKTYKKYFTKANAGRKVTVK